MLAFDGETPGKQDANDLLDFNKIGVEEEGSPFYDLHLSGALQDPQLGQCGDINSEFRETEEHAEAQSNGKQSKRNSQEGAKENKTAAEENNAHRNDDSISQSMLQEIEQRTSHLQSDLVAELDVSKA